MNVTVCAVIKTMKFTKIHLYYTGIACYRNSKRWEALTSYVVKYYFPNVLGIFSERRTDTSKEWQDYLKSHGLNPSRLCVDWETDDGKSGVVYYEQFMAMIE